MWTYSGILPWKKGVSGVKWRDMDEATFVPGFWSWITGSYTVCIGHRFTKANEIVLTNIGARQGRRGHPQRAPAGADARERDQLMDRGQALDFVREHGVVLVSASGPAPKLTEAIAGEKIKGSWWGHPKGKQIFPGAGGRVRARRRAGVPPDR